MRTVSVKVIVLNGSPRKRGNTRLMLDAAAEELESAGVRIEKLSLTDHDIQPCDGCEKCYKKPWDCPIKDDAVTVLKRMAGAEGMLLGSPVYFGGVTSQMKALFDRSIMPYQAMEFRDKVGGALSCGGGAHGGQELTIWQIVTFFTMHDMLVANCEGGLYGAMGVGNDRGDVKKDSEGLKSARNLGRRVAQLLKSR